MSALLVLWFGVPALVWAAYALCDAYVALCALRAWYRESRPALVYRAPTAPMVALIIVVATVHAALVTVALEAPRALALAVFPNPDYCE